MGHIFSRLMLRLAAFFCLGSLAAGMFSSVTNTAGAQSTARGEIVSYNEQSASLVVDVNSSDLRYNRIDLTGGILSITIAETTREAYLISADTNTDDLENAIRLTGFDPALDEISLVLIVGRNTSVLRHMDGETNPLQTFGARVGDAVRVDSIAPLPTPRLRETVAIISMIDTNGDAALNLSAAEAARLGLFRGVRGTAYMHGEEPGFLVIDAAEYFIAESADLYLMIESSENGGILKLVPTSDNRNTQSIAGEFDLQPGVSITLSYQGFDYGEHTAGRVTDIQGDGQQLVTEIPASYLDDISAPLGGYVVVAVNGIIRAAMVMDETMFAEAFARGGLSSNYVVLRQSGIIKIIYMLRDGRTAQGIFGAEIGSRVRMRPATAVESIVREEIIVKAVSEIAPDGFLYTDVNPFELSFLSVLVGQYVQVQINGISYRARVVDDALLTADHPNTDILVYPIFDHTIITQTLNNTLTAEVRFQASVGDVVIIERAPN